MDFVSLAFFAVAVVGLGSAATELASKHGRYVGLEAATVREATPYRARVEAAMNAVGSSN